MRMGAQPPWSSGWWWWWCGVVCWLVVVLWVVVWWLLVVMGTGVFSLSVCTPFFTSTSAFGISSMPLRCLLCYCLFLYHTVRGDCLSSFLAFPTRLPQVRKWHSPGLYRMAVRILVNVARGIIKAAYEALWCI